MLGKIDGITIWIVNTVLRLTIRRPLIDIARCIEVFARFPHGSDIVHLETEVIDSHP